MFWLVQTMLCLLFLCALCRNVWAYFKSGKGGATQGVNFIGGTLRIGATQGGIRGDESTTMFYGTYLAVNGLLIALCLSVDVIDKYKIFWVIIDTMIPAYLCILNPWSRNMLITWSQHIKKIELE